jgi:hypothetical protein
MPREKKKDAYRQLSRYYNIPVSKVVVALKKREIIHKQKGITP